MITLDDLTLPPDLLWTDEFRWNPVAQQETITLGGALIVQADAQLTGRPVTLAGGGDHGWVPRSLLESLRAKAAQTNLVMTLTLHDGAARSVMFTGERLTADPVWPIADPDSDQPYVITVYFREVNE